MKHLTMAFIRRDFLSYESKYMRLYIVSGIMLTFPFHAVKAVNDVKQTVVYLVTQAES